MERFPFGVTLGPADKSFTKNERMKEAVCRNLDKAHRRLRRMRAMPVPCIGLAHEKPALGRSV